MFDRVPLLAVLGQQCFPVMATAGSKPPAVAPREAKPGASALRLILVNGFLRYHEMRRELVTMEQSNTDEVVLNGQPRAVAAGSMIDRLAELLP